LTVGAVPHLPRLRGDQCQVWWASIGSCADWHAGLLDQAERERRGQYVRAADRDRFTVGVALTRLVLAGQLGLEPAGIFLDRACARCGKPHGRPRLSMDAPLDFSVSHSGDLIALAITRHRAGADRAVGVDVEAISAPIASEIPADVLSPAELLTFSRLGGPTRVRAFFRYWVRKEAVLKATGDGLRVPMAHLTLSGPDRPPRLAEWRGRPGFAAHVAIHDLNVRPGYASALAIVGPDAAVTCHDSAALLGQPLPSAGLRSPGQAESAARG
jgi:4'-phosphopantetheinyl transferase